MDGGTEGYDQKDGYEAGIAGNVVSQPRLPDGAFLCTETELG